MIRVILSVAHERIMIKWLIFDRYRIIRRVNASELHAFY